MHANGDKPAVGTERDMLGLRSGENDLSIYGDYRHIRSPIRPANVLNRKGQPGSNGETVLFAIEESELAAFGLKLGAMKPDTHGPIEAADACAHDETHRRIVATVSKWEKVKL